MLVQDIMTKRPTYVEARRPIREALRLLMELNVRHLPVLSEGEVVGMLSDKDLQAFSPTAVLELGPNASKHLDRAVSEFMSGDVLSIEPEDDVKDLVDIMLENKVGAVPVIDPHEGKLVGIVSYVDILKSTRDLL